MPKRFIPRRHAVNGSGPGPGTANATGKTPAMPVPLGGTRAEAMRRLQMGLIGVVAVLLLVGLASVIKDRAVQTESDSVAAAAATRPPESSPAGNDPLAEAGMVPEIPAGPTGRTRVPATASPPPSPGRDADAR